MTDLERKEQLIFSNTNTSSNVAVFGSKAQTGTMEFSDDPNIIQGVNNNGANWNNGWNSAVLNGNSPLMEDFNAISYVNSYNLAYLLQKGVAEWSENTTYFRGNICMVINENFEPTLYYSYIDSNKGNNPSTDENETYWKQLQLGGTGAPVGSIITSTIPLNNANLHLADGTKLAPTGIYEKFYNFMNNLKETNPDIFCTEEEYEKTLTINKVGNCGKYVITDEYIRLPTINGWIETTTQIDSNGTINQPGLPIIRGSVGLLGTQGFSELDAPFFDNGNTVDANNTGHSSIYHGKYLGFNASLSSPIYGSSTEVTSRGIKYLVYIVIGNKLSGADELITQANKIMADVDFKLKEQDSKISSYYMPDYTTAVSITGNFTAQYAGWLIGSCSTASTTDSYSYINNIKISSEWEDYQDIQVLMDKGDIFTTNAKNIELKFLKLKGETVTNN